ncbi:hypothetical protein, partial [Mycobacterium tuberculosis]
MPPDEKWAPLPPARYLSVFLVMLIGIYLL